MKDLQLDGLRHILSQLDPLDALSFQFSNKMIHHVLKHSGALKDYWEKQFKHLIAIEGEDNQNKAENILTQLRDAEGADFVSELLVGKGKIIDAAGREFRNLSAYGYAFWAGDTDMCRMMEQYMDDETKAKAHEECQRIASTGVTFTFQGEEVIESKHFDFQPLINAYQAYLEEATLLYVTDRPQEEWS